MATAQGALIGTLGGAAVGAAYGAIKYRTLGAAVQHSILGAMTGFLIGGFVGGSIYALGAGIAAVTPGITEAAALEAASIIVTHPLRAAAVVQSGDGIVRGDPVDAAFGLFGTATAYIGVLGFTPFALAVRALPYQLRRLVMWKDINIRTRSNRGQSQEIDEAGIGGLIENKDFRGINGKSRAEIDALVKRKVVRLAKQKMDIVSAPDFEIVNSSSGILPPAQNSDIAASRALQYRFESNDPNLKLSIAAAFKRLAKDYPEWELSAVFGVHAYE